MLKQTLDAFGIVKTHTTACHSQGLPFTSLVERFNHFSLSLSLSLSLSQFLRSYTDILSHWKWQLPLPLYAYMTASYSSTRVVSPDVLMFDRDLHSALLYFTTCFVTYFIYQHCLHAKLVEL